MPNIYKTGSLSKRYHFNDREKYEALDVPTIYHLYPGHDHHENCVILLLLHVADHVLLATPDDDDDAPRKSFRGRMNPVKYVVLISLLKV